VSRKSKATRTRSEILDAAWEMISEQGADVSMSDIAKAVGLSRQAIYLHFGTRGGLLMALVRRADDRFEIKEDFFAAMALADAGDRLDEALRVWFRFVRRIVPVARDLVRLRATDTDAAAAWEDRMRDLRTWIRQLVETFQAEGALAAGWDVDEAADYIWTASSVQVWDMLVRERQWPEMGAEIMLRQTIAALILRQKVDLPDGTGVGP